MLQKLLTLALLAMTTLLAAQSTRPLTIADFDRWQTIESPVLTADGRWVAWIEQPDAGDGQLVLRDTRSQAERRFARVSNFRFAADAACLVFTITPPRDTLIAQRRRKVEKNKLPMDTLAILTLQPESFLSAEPQRIPQLKNYQLPEKWPQWLAYGIKTPLPDSLSKKLDKESYRLVLRHLPSGDTLAFDGVKGYVHADEAPAFMLHTAGDNQSLSAGVYFFDPQSRRLDSLLTGKGTYSSLSIHRLGGKAAFVVDRDTTKALLRPTELFGWQKGQPAALPLAVTDSLSRVSEHAALVFSHQGHRLYFGRAPMPILQDTSLLEEEIVQVEVWTYDEPRLYTQQEVRLERDRKRAFTHVYHYDRQQLVALHDERAPDWLMADRGDAPMGLAYDETPYLLSTQWEGGPSRKDLYLVDVNSGSRQLLARAIHGQPAWSPGGHYVYWYSPSDTAWMVVHRQEKVVRQLSNHQLAIFYDEENDVPDHPSPYGLAGWTDNDAALYLYDRYDWWRFDPSGKTAPVRVTGARAQQRRLRYISLSREDRFLPASGRVLVHWFDEKNYEQGYSWLYLPTGRLEQLQAGPYSFAQRVIKARTADQYLWTQENFQEFPNLRLSSDLRQAVRISDANPWQSEYKWGSVEHVSWYSLDGQLLKGLLFKPAGFDPGKQYPMIVNFYERNSETLHDHRRPYAHRSQINYPHYLSNDYLIFNPDIPYRTGYPGESAYNALMPGVMMLLEQGFVDRNRIGIQGHSWGGYQIAYLITRTNLFRCAESGAPVVNMFSAYGGIRWESGLSRQFQYEHAQSRIGGSPWEYPLRYVENSPLFTLDKVTTPVLIMHNDNDGAVPWYQGIEMFTALRRLGKPAWLLNYNGEPHWPVKRQNRIDFQLRMSQFFDHYLKDAPMPPWMRQGVSPMAKGILQGY